MRSIVGILGFGSAERRPQRRCSSRKRTPPLYGAAIGIDWATAPFDAAQFAAGMNVQLEHDTEHAGTDVTGDDLEVTATIALAHLKEFPDYYVQLEELEESDDAFWDPYIRPGSEERLFKMNRAGSQRGRSSTRPRPGSRAI